MNYKTQVKIAEDNTESVLIKYLKVKRKNQSTEALAIIAKRGDKEACLVLLKEITDLTENVQKNLAIHSDVEVRKELAKRESLKWSTQKIIAEDREEAVLLEYLDIKREQRSEIAFEKIATYRSVKVKEKLAERSDLNYKTQLKIAEDNTESVLIKYLKVKRKNQSTEALVIIAKKADKEACLVLLKEIIALTENVQKNLAIHSDVEVRKELAKREPLKWSAQKIIAGDKKEDVVLAYLATGRDYWSENALEIVAIHRSVKVKEKLVENSDLNYKTQLKIAEDNTESVLIKYLEVKRKNQSTDALTIIAKKADKGACLVLLKEITDLPENVQKNLATHSNVEVRKGLAKRKKLK